MTLDGNARDSVLCVILTILIGWNNRFNLTQVNFRNTSNKKKRDSTDILSTISWNDLPANTESEISNLFASYFESVYNDTPHQQGINSNDNLNYMDTALKDFKICSGGVYKSLMTLNAKKDAGSDGLPNMFLRNYLYTASSG